MKSRIMSIITSVHLRIVRCHHRVEESPFLDVEKPTMGSLPLEAGSALRTQQLDRLWNVGRNEPGQEGVVLRGKWQTQDFWSQQK